VTSPAGHDLPVLIAGGGPAGLLLSLALDRAGIASVVVDPTPGEAARVAPFDGRALALMAGSKTILEQLGLWHRLAPLTTPVRGVRVEDAATGARVAYDAGEVGAPALAYGIENRRLRARLLELVLERRIPLLAPASLLRIERDADGLSAVLDDGRRHRTRLLVGADGRGSTVLTLAGIACERRDYGQTAIVLAIRHDRPHEHLVREILRPAGPLALLPIGDNVCSLTWIERHDEARQLLAGGVGTLRAALDARLAGALGRLEILGEPRGYPLGAHLARRSVAPRIVLVGDAAHGVHPIHAQGFNLAIRDVAALAAMLAGAPADPGESELLLAYERRRRADVDFIVTMTDGLNRLFSNDFGPAKAVRSLGLAALDRVAPLRRLAMRRGMGASAAAPLPTGGAG